MLTPQERHFLDEVGFPAPVVQALDGLAQRSPWLGVIRRLQSPWLTGLLAILLFIVVGMVLNRGWVIAPVIYLVLISPMLWVAPYRLWLRWRAPQEAGLRCVLAMTVRYQKTARDSVEWSRAQLKDYVDACAGLSDQASCLDAIETFHHRREGYHVKFALIMGGIGVTVLGLVLVLPFYWGMT